MSGKGMIIKISILTMMFLLALALFVPLSSFARTEARYEGIVGDTVFGNDIYASRSIQTLFHQQELNTTDAEHYDLSFPVSGDGLNLGPTAAEAGAGVGINSGAGIGTDGTGIGIGNDLGLGAGIGATTSANIVPFGPVNLAFPDIHEDVTQTVSYTSTGFFDSNYNYRPEANYGNVPLSANYISNLQQAIQPAATSLGTALYPEQFDTIALANKAKAAAITTPVNTTSPSNDTTTNQEATNQSSGIALNNVSNNSSDAGIISVPDYNQAYAINFFRPKNATSKPSDMPLFYPSVFDTAGKDGPVTPNPGYGTFSTNGAGSTGASLTGIASPGVPAGDQTANQTGNQTGNNTVNQSGNQSGNITVDRTPVPAETTPYGLTYADFNFDATTAQINQMPLLDRMWRNAHRGGTIGKAYGGDTSDPLWIDPYDRPNDVSMLDEHWYVLQSALNMCVPGTQIMPRYWSLMF